MLKSLVLVFFVSTLVGCSSSDSNNDQPATGGTTTGQFKDGNVVGLGYSSPSHSGTTNAAAEFTYEVGETIVFSVGAVTLGSTVAKATISPIDLINAGTSSSVEVQNIVRFLLMLDEDNDADNGIQISAAVTAAAANWIQVDFSTADLDAELISIISSVASVDMRVPVLATIMTAQNHLEATLRCIYAGAFVGSFNGDDSGHFGLQFDVNTGNASGRAYSTADMVLLNLSGGQGISFDQDVTFSSNFLSGLNVGSFSGQFSSTDAISGNWSNAPFGGAFTAQRIGGSAAANYRFTGGYTETGIAAAAGLFTFDVDESDVVTGVAYEFETNTSVNISGSVTGTTLTASTSDGTAITGILNKSTGGLSGSWSNGADSGNFGGSGCRLN